jgi:uncharacterized membrane protein YqjE
MPHTAATGPARPGLYDSIKTLAGTLIESVRLRLDLVAVEVAEEKARLLTQVWLAGAAFLCALLGLIFSGVFLVLLAWDTPYRLWVAGLVPTVFLLAAAGLGRACWLHQRSSPRPFAASLRELSRDVEALRSRDTRPVPR